VVETAVGWLDARLQTQLDTLEAALRAKGFGVGAKD
jgi:flagellar biosynthesis/type III secretory pathway protein FliH